MTLIYYHILSTYPPTMYFIYLLMKLSYRRFIIYRDFCVYIIVDLLFIIYHLMSKMRVRDNIYIVI